MSYSYVVVIVVVVVVVIVVVVVVGVVVVGYKTSAVSRPGEKFEYHAELFDE